jgi:ADP-ribose pyrophosphatase
MKRTARTVYEGKVVSVNVETWDEAEAEVVEHPDSVAIVAVDRHAQVTLVRQLRVPAGEPLLELPAGKLDEGEEPLAAAKRELEEETGLRGGEWVAVMTFFTTPGFCREKMHVFFATGLERGEPGAQDEDEDIELVRWPVDEIEARVPELRDGKTLVGLLLYLSRWDRAP